MNLEDQVVSLELAKRLKDLGVKQESVLWYDKEGDIFMPVFPENRHRRFSAFTIAELGEMLPHQLVVRDEEDRDWFDLELTKNNAQEWNLRYASNGSSPYPWMQDKSEADARAKMLIYLIEKGLVKP